MMSTVKRYPLELKERAVRLVMEARQQSDGRAACARIARQLDVKDDTLRNWVHRAEVDRGLKPGVTSDESARVVELEREVRELRRANAILRSASAFFAAEPGRPSPR